MSGGTTAGAMSGSSSGTVSVSLSGTTSGAASSGAVTSGATGARSGTASSGTVSSGGTASSGTVSSGGTVSGSGTAISGTVSSSGMTSSGAIGITPMADAGPDSGNPLVLGTVPSAGCGQALTIATGMWVAQPTGCAQGVNNQGTSACQAIPPGSTVPARATHGSPEYRGWWVYVPTGYDPSKAYPVIYEGAGCGDPNFFDAGKEGYPYQLVDDNGAIQVGLDYDTYSDLLDCYDTRTLSSNDFTFFPWLMNQIEDELCVDTSRELISGYGSGASLAEQLGCAFADRLRAEVGVAAGESDLGPALLPTCASHPIAAMFVHDFDDTDEPYAEALPACSSALVQNGCSVTDCSDPTSTTLTSVYVPPNGVTLPAQAQCRQFNGCPSAYPVVFCTTYSNDGNNDQLWGGTSLFWDFMRNKLGQ